MDFISRLKHDLTGRPDSRFVYVNNFEVERAWATGSPRLPGASVTFERTVVNRMEEIGVLLTGPGDVVLLKAPLDDRYAEYLRSVGELRGACLAAGGADPDRTVTEDALASPAALAALRALDDGNTYLMPLGISASEQRLADRTGLPLAGPPAEVCRAVNGKVYSRRLVEAIGVTAVPGRICERVGELAGALAEARRGGARAVVKESLGVSGRGMVVIADDRAADRLVRLVGRRGPDSPADLVVETWIEHAQSLNYQFVVSRSGRVCFETVKAELVRDGVHQGHRFPVELPAAVTAELTAAADAIGKVLFADGYFGVVGVDALLGPDGTLYPCLEINARFNMSTYVRRVAERHVLPGRHALAAAISLRLHRRHSFDEVAGALGELLLAGSGQSGVLVSNFATLNAAAEQHGSFRGRLYVLCVASNPARVVALRGEAERRLRDMAGGS